MRPIIAYWKQSLQDAERNRLTLRHDNHIRCKLTKLATGQPNPQILPTLRYNGRIQHICNGLASKYGHLVA